MLVNHLENALKKSDSSRLTTEQLNALFQKVQDTRRDRVSTLMDSSHEQQRLEGVDTLLLKFTAIHLLPAADIEDVLYHFSRTIPMASKLDIPHSGLKARPKLIPFKDELACDPTPRGIYGWLQALFFVACGLVCYYGMWVWSAHYGLDVHLEAIVAKGTFSYDTTFPLKRTYTGLKPLDEYLAFLAAIFVPGLKNWHSRFGMFQLYFLGMLVQPIAIFVIEACRPRN